MLIPQTIPPHSMPMNQIAGGCINPSLYLPKSKLYSLSDGNLPQSNSEGAHADRRPYSGPPCPNEVCSQYGVSRTTSKFDVRERRQTTIPTRWPKLTPKNNNCHHLYPPMEERDKPAIHIRTSPPSASAISSKSLQPDLCTCLNSIVHVSVGYRHMTSQARNNHNPKRTVGETETT